MRASFLSFRNSLIFVAATALSVILGMAAVGKPDAAKPQENTQEQQAEANPCAPAPDAKAAGEVDTAAPETEDISALVRDYNDPKKFIQPPSEFRPGHVTPKTLDPKALSKRPDGFAVRMPSGSPIVSPAVYDGKVFVSGGFGSREFYAFDALTGAVVWAKALDDDGPSTAACDDGVCAFNTESCTLFVVDANSGNMIWSKWLGDPLASAPTIADGLVFTSYPVGGGHGGIQQQIQNAAPQIDSSNGSPAPAQRGKLATGKRPPGQTHALAAFELKTGKIIWQSWLDSEVMSAPVAEGDKLYATSFAGTVYTWEHKDGKLISAVRSRATSAPTVVDGEIYYSKRTDKADDDTVAEGIARGSAADGRIRSVRAAKSAPYLDKRVQAGSGMAKKGVELDAGNGFSGGAPATLNAQAAEDNVGQSSVATMQAFQGSRVLNEGRWNYTTMGDELVCTDAREGERKWAIKLEGDLAAYGGFLAAPPASAGKYLVLGTVTGEVLLVERESGKKAKSWTVGSAVRSQPVVHGGWIYVGTQDGRLVALDTKDATLTGWAQWGGNARRNK